MVLAACLTASILLPLHASQPADTGRSRLFRYLMGTSVRVEVYGGASASARNDAAEEAFGAVHEVDRVMSDYRADSELSRLNAVAATTPVVASAPLLAVLRAALGVSRASDGAFDITERPLLAAWGLKDGHPRVAGAAHLAALRPLVDYRRVHVDDTTGRVALGRPGMALDLGGIAKGFAVEVAAGSLRRRGLSGVVDASGVQFMVGTPMGKATWSVGIADPAHPGQLLGAIDVDGGAVATVADLWLPLPGAPPAPGQPFDPRTLQPSHASLSATVVSPDGTLANALAHAVFVLGPETGLRLLATYPDTWGVVFGQRGPHDAPHITPGHERAFHGAR